MIPSRWLRRLPFSSNAVARHLDASLPDLAGIGPVLFGTKGLCTGTLSAPARLQCSGVGAIVAEILGPRGHLMIAPDGIVAWRSPAPFGAGDATNGKALAHDALADWRPGQRLPTIAEGEAFRVRGDAASILGQGPTVREQTLADVRTGQAIG